MRKQRDYAAIFAAITRSQETLMAEHSGITICVPETEMWDYAIPENYTNYQDGFLMPNYDMYRGLPLFDHPQFGRLYLRWEVPYYARDVYEREKFLCFDRHGGKYTFIVTAAPCRETGNPSYFRFLPKVKKYTPKRYVRESM